MVDNKRKFSPDIIKTIEELLSINNIKKISINELSLTEKIGEGGQAKVYKGKWQSEMVAVKILSEIDIKCLAHEIVILSNLVHENIPKFYGMILEGGIIGMVSQCILGKSLDECIKTLKYEEKVSIVKTISSALEYIHSIKFIHRDLKPENILIEQSTCKAYLIDFGIAKVITQENYVGTRTKGTILYLAPEAFEVVGLTDDSEIIAHISTKVDVWAFGCIMSYIFSGDLPWTPKYKNRENVIQNCLMKKYAFPIPTCIKDEKLINILNMAFEIEYNKRATMKDIKELVFKL